MLAKIYPSPQDSDRTRQPWRCLCRASEQMTRTAPPRRMILQFRQIFFTEARTFMIYLRNQTAIAKGA